MLVERGARDGREPAGRYHAALAREPSGPFVREPARAGGRSERRVGFGRGQGDVEVREGVDAAGDRAASGDPRDGALARAEREIARLRAEVAALSSDRADWLTVLAHELRTPLTVVCGYNRLLLSGEAGPLTADQTRYLEESTRSCRRLDRFIEGLLGAVHDGFLEKRLEIAPNDLETLLADVCRMLAPLLEARGLRVELEVEPAARRARFDTTGIEQVVTNLLGNAVRYSKAGGTLRVFARRRDPEAVRRNAGAVEEPACTGDAVAVSVVDQGPGIPPADRERVFEPMVRIGGSGDGDGLGLGLAICRRIVVAHGGRIRGDDAPGGGSRFTFTLPAGAAAPIPASAPTRGAI